MRAQHSTDLCGDPGICEAERRALHTAPCVPVAAPLLSAALVRVLGGAQVGERVGVAGWLMPVQPGSLYVASVFRAARTQGLSTALGTSVLPLILTWFQNRSMGQPGDPAGHGASKQAARNAMLGTHQGHEPSEEPCMTMLEQNRVDLECGPSTQGAPVLTWTPCTAPWHVTSKWGGELDLQNPTWCPRVLCEKISVWPSPPYSAMHSNFCPECGKGKQSPRSRPADSGPFGAWPCQSLLWSFFQSPRAPGQSEKTLGSSRPGKGAIYKTCPISKPSRLAEPRKCGELSRPRRAHRDMATPWYEVSWAGSWDRKEY